MNTWSKRALKYTLLPGLLPRLKDFFTSGFQHIAYLMAVVYRGARLLPADHPYLNPANRGRYGILHVIAQAASNLEFRKENADQIAIFIILLAGLVILFLQAGLLIVAVVAQNPVLADSLNDILGNKPAAAQAQHPYNLGPAQDLAFITLDRVFGLIGVFDSCVTSAEPCLDMRGNPLPDTIGGYPTSFNMALNATLQFYALGIFMVSLIIIIYFVVTLVAETAQTGTPFGQRYTEGWVPIRLILFFALLVPLTFGDDNKGLNTAQMITFWTAKYGSNFATNAWGKYNSVLLANNYYGTQQKLKSVPNIPEVNELVRFMFVAKVCKKVEGIAYWQEYGGAETIDAWIVRPHSTNPLVLGPDIKSFVGTSYVEAFDFSGYGSITIQFGVQEQPAQTGQPAPEKINPVCGEIIFTSNHADPKNAPGQSDAVEIQSAYFEMLQTMWRNYEQFDLYAECLRSSMAETHARGACDYKLNADFATMAVTAFQSELAAKIEMIVDAGVASGEWGVPRNLMEKGWAGAAIWYNTIAEMNGDIVTAAMNMPQPSKYPFVFESFAAWNTAKNEYTSGLEMFDPNQKNNLEAAYARPKDKNLHAIMYKAFEFWEGSNTFKKPEAESKGNPVIDMINAIFGTSGIYSMRAHADVHPLAQLSALGKGMMDATLRNIAIGKLGGLMGSAFNYVTKGGNAVGKFATAASTFIEAIGWSTMSMAFVMYYVLPFMPFVYFFFAIGGWMKALFEAIVAMPLWALAHIRIDGPGLAGPGATNGYFLLLELFLRPVLTVFGLIASVSIFAAVVSVMNDIFALIVPNVSGFDHNAEAAGVTPTQIAYYRGAIDQFFFTVIYVILCYMMGLGCFKLIDAIPNNIMRWFGVSVQTFDEKGQDFAGELTSKSYQGTMLLGGKLQGGQVAALLQGG
ncbi:MAG: DotA/TraY family protein [Alphaproteobacteria bacterium]